MENLFDFSDINPNEVSDILEFNDQYILATMLPGNPCPPSPEYCGKNGTNPNVCEPAYDSYGQWTGFCHCKC